MLTIIQSTAVKMSESVSVCLLLLKLWIKDYLYSQRTKCTLTKEAFIIYFLSYTVVAENTTIIHIIRTNIELDITSDNILQLFWFKIFLRKKCNVFWAIESCKVWKLLVHWTVIGLAENEEVEE